MRPGLDKPGALPLLALIIFSLLTLVPSLPSIYSLKLADFTHYISKAQVPLIQEKVAELSSDSPDRTPWVLAAPSRPRLNRFSRPARLANGAPTISSETPSVENRSRSSYPAESTFLFSRRARAFRTYFIQQLDDIQFLTPFSTRSVSTGAIPDPTLTPNLAPLPASIDDSKPTATPLHNESISTPLADPSPQLPFTDMWQQACQVASGLWELANEPPSPKFQRLIRWGTSYAQSAFSSSKPVDTPTPLILPQNDTQPEVEECTCMSALNKTLPPSNEQSTDAAGRHSSELQGSCMAVVIGLVAGIMWF
ncbi:uncharacterized protein N7484_009219 [Penicillium longicatenatum]|uniref:uncharacterized protein n=1 Tax=Penicillium longicatenatum TaxID=1561947 RepID=UPI0025478C3C|nr:uncharacterized protein N7484_009219 [Penicillium longicatenatum]KAJ5635906.1 hypothetical protein N7484_009219 [Penicillium longicatenatum]